MLMSYRLNVPKRESVQLFGWFYAYLSVIKKKCRSNHSKIRLKVGSFLWCSVCRYDDDDVQ